MTTTIRNRLVDVAGNAVPGVTVRAILRGLAFAADGQTEVARHVDTTTDDDGYWELDVTAGGALEDPGAYYEVREGKRVWAVAAPSSGMYWLRDVVTDPPASSGVVLGLTRAQADALYQPLGGGVGDLYVTDDELAAALDDLTAADVGADPAGAAAAAVAAVPVDPAAGTAGLRTLGSGGQQAARGDHSHGGGVGGPAAFQQDFAVASALWTVTHNLGFVPNVTCYGGLGLTGGEIVGAITENSTTTTVIAFAVSVSGSVNCS